MTRPNSVVQSRIVARLLVIGALMAGGLGVGLGVWWGYGAWQWRAFFEERHAINASVNSWRDNAPAQIDRHIWQEVVTTLYNALGNVCFTPNEISIDEMRRLRAEVEGKSREPITVETLDWLWWRLGKTGSHGAEYIRQMQPLWDEAREALRPGAERPK
jgi:hypothetical protein